MQILSDSTAKQNNILVLFPILIYACCFTENLTGYGLFFSTSISDTFLVSTANL
ncbi:MAG: hypothetical protein SPK70_04185 [Succinivibrio dextrinosolvens]|nr:hypothetical protein [Succinivibrio dextrinosolvens]MDY6470253.1 hypothetical protein [Succinivibrio dextrinosolvens]